jgi:dihydroaeruginoic acid synthetase
MPISRLDFDLSVYEIFGPLMAGGMVVMLGPDQVREPDAWLELIERHRVTVWDSVPALLDALVSVAETGEPPSSLRLVLTGGDWIPLDLPDRLHRLLPDCVFVACGGATEGSIYSNYFQVDRTDPDWASIPYGRPLGNQCYRVVDAAGHDCPDWVAGELWIGGAGVARGYRGDADRTARQFPTVDGTRWYRTGDMGRYRPDGVLEFLGRTDHQVKLRGYRIELGEVESALTSFDQVAQAVVLVAGEDGHQRLIAYLKPKGEAMDLDALRDHVGDRLPDYAQPADLLMVPEFPLNTNGKVDRKQLASWAVPDPEPVPDEPPQDELEEALAQEWAAVLDTPVTSRHATFSALGGDSLRSMRLAAALKRRFHRPFPLRRLRSAATLADMAGLVRELTTGENHDEQQGRP